MDPINFAGAEISALSFSNGRVRITLDVQDDVSAVFFKLEALRQSELDVSVVFTPIEGTEG